MSWQKSGRSNERYVSDSTARMRSNIRWGTGISELVEQSLHNEYTTMNNTNTNNNNQTE